MSHSPLISICCITYNHEKYIREALDGFLLQKTSYPIEIIVHDDCSTDRTKEIVEEYWRKNPGLIFPIFQEVNQFGQGKRILPIITKRAKGKYIALCEGDDYWTDPDKLQMQVEFLENNDKFSAAAHQSIVIHENMRCEDHIFATNVKKVIETEDMFEGRLFHTASLVFREKIIRNNTIPDEIIGADRYLNFICSFCGPIRFFDKSMCVYRKSSSGISSWITYEILKKDLNMPAFLSEVNRDFKKSKYLSYVHKTLFTYTKNIPLSKLLKHYSLYVLFSFSDFPKNCKPTVSVTYHYLVKPAYLRVLSLIKLNSR